jgi:hypothetical protein
LKKQRSILWYRFYAAGAGRWPGTRPAADLDLLVAGDWQGQPEWLERSFMFGGLQDNPEFKARVAELRRRQG